MLGLIETAARYPDHAGAIGAAMPLDGARCFFAGPLGEGPKDAQNCLSHSLLEKSVE
jgi:hypothetical protein